MNIFYNIESLNLIQECGKFFLLSKVSFFIFDTVFFLIPLNALATQSQTFLMTYVLVGFYFLDLG